MSSSTNNNQGLNISGKSTPSSGTNTRSVPNYAIELNVEGVKEFDVNTGEYFDFATAESFDKLTEAQRIQIFNLLSIPETERKSKDSLDTAEHYFTLCKRAFFRLQMDSIGRRNIYEYQSFNPVLWRQHWLRRDDFHKDVAKLVLLGLTTGNRIVINRRSSEAIQSIQVLNQKYNFLSHNLDTKNDALAFTLTRCVQCFPIYCALAQRNGIVRPKLEIRGLPLMLSFPGSAQLIPNELWPAVCDLFYCWNAVFGMMISQGKGLTNKSMVEKYRSAVNGVPISEVDYHRNTNFINLSRDIPQGLREAYNRFFVAKVSQDSYNNMVISSNSIRETRVYKRN